MPGFTGGRDHFLPQVIRRRFLEEVYIRLDLKDCSEDYRQEKMGMFWVSGYLGGREGLSHCSAVCPGRVIEVL